MNDPSYNRISGAIAHLIPEGAERDELLNLVRLGASFKQHHAGKRAGSFSKLVKTCVERSGAPYSFAKLLTELEYEALRREWGHDSMIEKVDREWQLITFHVPKGGRVQRTFSALEWHFTKAKKNLKNDNSSLPVNFE